MNFYDFSLAGTGSGTRPYFVVVSSFEFGLFLSCYDAHCDIIITLSECIVHHVHILWSYFVTAA